MGDARTNESSLLLIVYHRDGAEVIALVAARPVVVGRAHPSDRLIVDPSLSRQHARFTLTEGVVSVEDLGSRNGTWVAGERIERAELHRGDEARLGSVIVAVHGRDAGETSVFGLESHDVLRRAVEGEIVRARHFARSFALLMVRSLASPGAHVSRWSAGLRARLRPIDYLGLYSASVVEILLAEVTPEAAVDLARAIIAPRASSGLTLVAGLAVFPGSATSCEELVQVCRSALWEASDGQRLCTAHNRADVRASPVSSLEQPVVRSAAMRAVLDQVDRIAASSIAVLLHGETGVGKEVIARAVHERGPRRGGPMVCLNCAAIPAQLLESTLFGHERGAFTGADTLQKGAFESAAGGTLLLDEIGDLPPPAQAALLRIIETKRVMRVGSTRELPVDVRIIASTHRDLEVMSKQGQFRFDLMHRLNGITINIPPLRARPEEIPLLTRYFLKRSAAEDGRAVNGIDNDALRLLEVYPWPGNVRELRNAVERAVAIARSELITPDDLPEKIRAGHAQEPASEAATDHAGASVNAADIRARVQSYEGKMIVEALRAANGNQTAAARQLEMPLRTLVRKIKLLGLKTKLQG